MKLKKKRAAETATAAEDFAPQKNKKTRRLKLHHYVLIIVIVIMVTIIIVSGGLNAILRWALSNPIKVPDLIWIVVISALSSIITYFVMKKFIVSPLSKLESAMTKVSEGDFTVRLETNSRIDEIKRSYDSFNIMVKELRSTELLQSDFVANVSHEFKTPLSTIEGYITLLQGAEDNEREEYVSKILLSTKRLSNLIGEILLLSKIENHSIAYKSETFRLDEQIRQAVVFLESKWEAKEMDFDAVLENTNFCGNEKLLFRVWVNLIDNAIKFSPVGGVITLELKKLDNNAVVTVKDSGTGISDDAKKHVFDKFFQEDNSHSKEGNGLGLTLVKRIVSVHNGTVTVSDNEGCGTVFTVILPIDNGSQN